MRALFALALALAATAARADEAPFAEQAGPRGILYAAHKKGAASPTLYLFGTIHVGKQDVTPFSHAVLGALAGARRLALEADVSRALEAAGMMIKMGHLPAGDTLDRHLSPKVASALHAVMKRKKLDENTIETMRPWAASAMLELVAATDCGLDGNYAADSYLAAWAKAHAVPIVELEGFAYQMKVMSDVPDADQAEMVSVVVDELDKASAGKDMEKLYDAWRTGDEKALEVELQKDRDKSAASKRFQKRLLDDRNVGMADKAEGLVSQPGDTFLAVGSAHLVGRKGLVALLRSRGYEVAPVKQR